MNCLRLAPLQPAKAIQGRGLIFFFFLPLLLELDNCGERSLRVLCGRSVLSGALSTTISCIDAKITNNFNSSLNRKETRIRVSLIRWVFQVGKLCSDIMSCCVGCVMCACTGTPLSVARPKIPKVGKPVPLRRLTKTGVIFVSWRCWQLKTRSFFKYSCRHRGIS